ncbi:ATPase family AAA domain-containing protein 3 [Lasiodiplodia hormozganensis]|uniref:ATPase family AAA domain-containing protein 3 n=1 Tax=Lasiodiplodia hormozganensis TaxID=869390 RepID=A0AA40CGQ6_9PEZI|nr:ATPase family AAA domain-containing protein 3 [Lasiodiplodia hormozganensis]
MADSSTANAPVAAAAEAPKKISPKIRYKVECEDSYGPNFDCKQDDTPFDLQVTAGPTDIDETMPVFEIITSIKVASKRPKYADYMKMFNAEGPMNLEDSEDEDEPSAKEKEKPKKTLEGKRILDVNETRMVIHSPLLLTAIREVVEYYPRQNLTGDTITVHEPYCALVHHITELRNYSNNLALERTPAGADESEKTDADVTYEHLQILLDFLDPHVEKTVLPARRRLKKDEATVTFDDLWYLMRPGSLAYAKYEDIWLGVMIKEAESLPADSEGAPPKWKITGWCMDNSWYTRCVGYAEVSVDIPFFEGEKHVTSLPIYPREFYDKTDANARREKFEARGRKMRDILWHGHAYVTYEGDCMDEKKRVYKGPMMAEATIPSGETVPDHKWSLTWDYSLEDGRVDPKQRPGFPQPIYINTENHARELLTDDHLFLMCPVMPGFALAEKFWSPVHIDHMHPVEEPKYAVPDANIGDENSEIIKALSHRQLKSKVKWTADFVQHKGAGVAVLLYGPPGVGKTYTVELTALHTRRPMVSLTIGDLGTNEESIETEITKWFDLAHRWKAVLLIDEADIFLERRSTDLARNGIVTAFLRKMEYFGGLLFLTTNRVEHIDDAFMSRVHVAIGFEKLDVAKRRGIWASFLDKLEREAKGQISVSDEARKFVLESDEMAEVEWNGREIRNAFQSAIAIAEYEASKDPDFKEEVDEIVVQIEHFRRVMLMSKKFRDHVEKARKDNESEWSDL